MAYAVRVCTVIALVIFTGSAPSRAGSPRCDVVQRAIDAQVTASTAAPVILRLGPHFSPEALPKLLELGRSGALTRRLAAYGAFGLTRHAAGLRRIAGTSAPADEAGLLAYSLATLALGANTHTATVSRTIRTATVTQRRAAMWVLSRMRHARPRQMLYSALGDADLEVRLTAAEALVGDRSRAARRTLVELLAVDQHRGRAVEALISVGHRFTPEQLRRLSPDETARAYARAEARHARLPRLGKMVDERNDGVRAGVLAAVATRPDASPAWLARRCRRWTRRYGSVGEGEIVMTGALIGDEAAQTALVALTGEARSAALRVFSAFAETPSVETRIDTSTAGRIAQGFEAWWPTLARPDRARLLQGMGAVDAPTSVRFARRVLPDASGATLVAVARILGEHGTVDDAVALVAAVEAPSNPAHGPMLAAAARLCRLEGR